MSYPPYGTDPGGHPDYSGAQPAPNGPPYPGAQPASNDPRHGLPGPWQPAASGPMGAQQHPGAANGPQNAAGGGAGYPPPLGAPLPSAPYVRVLPRRPGAVRGLAWVVALVILALCALLTLFVIGLSTGPVGSLVGLLLAVLPVFPVAGALLWLDRYEDEPPALLAFAFAWGATAAVVIALVFSIGSMIVIAGAGGSDNLGAVLVAPIVEETAKGLAIVGVLLIRRTQFNGIVDGIVYAGLAGLGFAFAENILYLGHAFLEGGITGAVVTFVLRCIMGPFAHPMFTAATGIGLGLAVRTSNRALKVIYPLAGWIVAMCLHSLWNVLSMIPSEGGWLVAYVLIQMPIFATFVTFAIIVRRREARLINQHLMIYAQSGWITGHELAMLSSPQGRRQARAWAGRVGGRAGKRSMRDFQEVASELAFLRERMSHQAATADAQRTEADMLRTMWQLRLDFQPRPGYAPG